MIRIVLNGQTCEIEPGLSLEALLVKLDLPIGRVAVERNRQVVPRTGYAAEPVEPGDRFEVVTLVGGG